MKANDKIIMIRRPRFVPPDNIFLIMQEASDYVTALQIGVSMKGIYKGACDEKKLD